jgi:murein DD-endopeptidase MepM/ murein hydrolase activator NlpD
MSDRGAGSVLIAAMGLIGSFATVSLASDALGAQSSSRQSAPEEVAIHPYTRQHFVCLEHPLGQLTHLGDALGSDCVIVGLDSGARQKFPNFYRGTGSANADWIGWNANVLAPFDGVVDSVNINRTTNTPGSLGKERASVVIFRRADGLRVLYAHLQSISVNVGDSVRSGQAFAKVGNNGAAYFPHTHIGSYKDGKPFQIRFDLSAMGSMSRSR